MQVSSVPLILLRHSPIILVLGRYHEILFEDLPI